MLHLSIHATTIELTAGLEEYARKRVSTLENRMRGEGNADVELGKTSNHHKQGEVYRAEIKLTTDGKTFYTVAEQEDLYAAIDEAKDQMMNELVKAKDRGDTIFRRGARSVKKMLKGISNRNPFTSKY